MTNEVVQAGKGLAGGFCENFVEEFSHGQELWDQVVTWLAEKGIGFAVSVVVAVVMLLLGWLAIRLVRTALVKALQKGTKSRTLFTSFVVSATTKSLWAILIVTVLGKLGVNVGPIIAGLGVTGFILGFAFQESLGNLASGLMIAMNAPFKIGDYVIVAGHEGTIVEMNMMATVLTTADNKKVVVPNKSAWGAPIVNYSAMEKRRVDLKFGIGYGKDLGKAIGIVMATLKTVPGVLAEPAPSVSVASLDDNEITLNVRPWAKNADYWSVYSATYQIVLGELEKAGFDSPYPQLDVHMVGGGGEV